MSLSAVIHDAATDRWLRFNEPRRVIEVHTVEAVVPSLRSVVKAVSEEGLYAAGCVGYEAAPAFDDSFRIGQEPTFPLLWFGLYDAPEVIELPWTVPGPAFKALRWTPSVGREEYENAVAGVRELIAGGETYQVNYTFRLTAPFDDDPWELFLRLIRAQRAGYGAYVDSGRFAVCSASPELFFHKENNCVTARPMKGTTPRGRTLEEDEKQAAWLRRSEKNRAENVMIVDMIRNDLGRIARIGSVNVPRLFEIERYPTLWQMTSTVTAEIESPVDEIFGALFPCASITGAPKSHTTGIIAALETTPRNIYTGAIGYIAPNGTAQFNVAIRTVLVDRERKRAEYGVGGGIVWDSTGEGEYGECVVKSRILMDAPVEFSLLETLLYSPEDGWFLLDGHLRRLHGSARYFGIHVETGRIVKKLEALAETLPPASHKVRVLVSQEGAVTCEVSPLDTGGGDGPVRLGLAKEPVDSSNRFLHHKTTNRAVCESAVTAVSDCDDVLLWNERGEITETTIANVVFRIGGELVTPPVSCGLLAGVYRADMIERGLVRERIVFAGDIETAEQTYVINSVRKIRRAECVIKDGR